MHTYTLLIHFVALLALVVATKLSVCAYLASQVLRQCYSFITWSRRMTVHKSCCANSISLTIIFLLCIATVTVTVLFTLTLMNVSLWQFHLKYLESFDVIWTSLHTFLSSESMALYNCFIVILIMRHLWKYRCYRPVSSKVPCHCLSVCLSVMSCIMLKWQKISTRFLLHTTAICLSHTALKLGLHRSTLSSVNVAAKWPAPCWFLSDGDIRWQMVAEWLEIAQWSQWKPPSLFRIVTMLTSYDLSSLKMGSKMHPPGQTTRRVLPPGEYDRRCRQGSSLLCQMSLWAEQWRFLPNYFSPCFSTSYWS